MKIEVVIKKQTNTLKKVITPIYSKSQSLNAFYQTQQTSSNCYFAIEITHIKSWSDGEENKNRPKKKVSKSNILAITILKNIKEGPRISQHQKQFTQGH